MKKCIRCQESKELLKFGNHPTARDGKRNQCEACRYQLRKARPGHQDQQRYWNLVGRYGITPEEYSAMETGQGKRCKICQEETKLFVDHNHETGMVRGLLCHHCNTMLGLAKDSPQILEGAIAYLEARP
jgi:hypothetical protein